MFNIIYKKIVHFLVKTHIARIDFGSESEVDEFYDWLYSKKSHKRKSSIKNKVIKIFACSFGAFAFICLALMLICNQIVVNNAEGKVFSDIDNIKYNNVGLLLGTTPQARIGRITNAFFTYRIDAAEQLYKAKKIEKILISGDENSLDGVNEPECMRDSLVARGVPADAIILDGKGYKTINSVINANKVYGLKSFTIISQKFHNERALYQAEHLGLDVENIQAYNAKDPKSRRAYLTTIREYFARVKMFLDLLTSNETEINERIEPLAKVDIEESHKHNSDSLNMTPPSNNMPQGWQWYSEGAFKYPKSFHHEEIFIEDATGVVEVFSKGRIQLCFWPSLGVWSTFIEFPKEGVWLSPTERVKDVTYRAESKFIFSGHTQNGKIFYMNQKILSGGEVSHSNVLVLIYPPSMKNRVSALINEVANW